MYLAVMVGKFSKQVVREWCPSTTGNGLGILCLRSCYRRFTIFSRALSGLSNKHSCSDRINWDQIVRWTRGGGGTHPSFPWQVVLAEPLDCLCCDC